MNQAIRDRFYSQGNKKHVEYVIRTSGMNPPGRWSMEQTSTLMKHHGYHHNKCEFYAVMNMISSDYGDTLCRYGVDRPEVIAELAHNFLDDGDAVDGKTVSYYRNIARNS